MKKKKGIISNTIDHTCRIYVVAKGLTLSRKDIARKTLTKRVVPITGKLLDFSLGK